MSISASYLPVRFNCDGVQVDFPFTFPITDDDELDVYLVDPSGTVSTLVLSTNYTVARVGNNWDNGGTVTTSVIYTSGYKIVLARDIPLTQLRDFITGDRFPANEMERALDKLTMIAQQVDEKIERQIAAPVTDVNPQMELPAAADRAGFLLGFDASGDVTAAVEASTVTPFTGDLLSAVDIDELTEKLYTKEYEYKGRQIYRGSPLISAPLPETHVRSVQSGNVAGASSWTGHENKFLMKSNVDKLNPSGDYTDWCIVGMNGGTIRAEVHRVSYSGTTGAMSGVVRVALSNSAEAATQVYAGRLDATHFYAVYLQGGTIRCIAATYDPSAPSITWGSPLVISASTYWTVLKSLSLGAIGDTAYPAYNTKRYFVFAALRNVSTWERRLGLIEVDGTTCSEVSTTTLSGPSVAITSRMQLFHMGFDAFDRAGYYYFMFGFSYVDPTTGELIVEMYGGDNHISGASIWNESGPNFLKPSNTKPIVSYDIAEAIPGYSRAVWFMMCTIEESGTYDQYQIELLRIHTFWQSQESETGHVMHIIPGLCSNFTTKRTLHLRQIEPDVLILSPMYKSGDPSRNMRVGEVIYDARDGVLRPVLTTNIVNSVTGVTDTEDGSAHGIAVEAGLFWRDESYFYSVGHFLGVASGPIDPANGLYQTVGVVRGGRVNALDYDATDGLQYSVGRANYPLGIDHRFGYSEASKLSPNHGGAPIAHYVGEVIPNAYASERMDIKLIRIVEDTRM